MDKNEIEILFKYLGLNKDFECQHNLKSNHPALQSFKSYRLSHNGEVLNKICEIDVHETVNQPSLLGEFYVSFENSKLILDFEVEDSELNHYLETVTRHNKILETFYPKDCISHEKIFFNIDFNRINNELICKNKEFQYCTRINHPTIKSKDIGVDVERLINEQLKKIGIDCPDEYNIDDLIKIITMAVV